jgi:hypothetical protein
MPNGFETRTKQESAFPLCVEVASSDLRIAETNTDIVLYQKEKYNNLDVHAPSFYCSILSSFTAALLLGYSTTLFHHSSTALLPPHSFTRIHPLICIQLELLIALFPPRLSFSY